MSEPLFKDAVEIWLARKSRTWCPETATYVRHLAKGWVQSFGEKEVGALVVADVEMHEGRRDDGVRSAAALNQERVYLRGFFKWAKLNRWVDHDPTCTWPFRRVEVSKAYVVLHKTEEDRLLAVSPLWLQRFVVMAIYTGLREGTIRKLTWEMVKPGWVLEIPAAIMKQRKGLVMPILPKVQTVLGERSEGLLLPELPSAPRVWRAFKRAIKKAGLNPATSPHDLRRSWVARLSHAGVPAQTIMRLGGWRTMGVLLTHYTTPLGAEEASRVLAMV